jgi:predicted metal-dependent phosphoesterase TrpH
VATINEAFDLYIGREGPAYVEREKMTPREAVETLARFGAPPILAHPRYMKNPEAVIPELKEAGLVGMEVYYKDSDEELMARMSDIAKRHGILPLGGSDYHALKQPGEREPGDIPLPERVAKDFLESRLTWVPTRELN